jgi:hypothetical protein
VRRLELLLQRDGSGPGRGHSSQVAGVIHCCLLEVSIVCQFLFRLQLQILALSACSYLPILQLQILALSATFYLYFSFSFQALSASLYSDFSFRFQALSATFYVQCSQICEDGLMFDMNYFAENLDFFENGRNKSFLTGEWTWTREAPQVLKTANRISQCCSLF